ncbi:hypothetical protein [Caballeronia sp. dw_19]|uniref:hypothetical protein n=1 Tax=unclassified Caballeronia TaxID=2646786 RepID=UPI001BD5BFFA|nr:hypothetical protein [Caballeronia sp. dw_19]
MDAKIIGVIESKGIFATHWEFDFTIGNSEGKAVAGTVSLDEAIAFANRRDLGPVADMCRAIKTTPPPEFSWLVGRIFRDPR